MNSIARADVGINLDRCSYFVLIGLMAIETIGEAWRSGWRVTAKCAAGKRDGMKSVRPCIKTYGLDLESLVWTRGADMPLSRLGERLKCPTCGSRKVVVMFSPPAAPVRMRA